MEEEKEAQHLPLQSQQNGPLQSDALYLDPADSSRDINKFNSQQFASNKNFIKTNTKTSVELSDARDRTDIPLSTRRFIMFTFLSSAFWINVEMGAIPAALLSI